MENSPFILGQDSSLSGETSTHLPFDHKDFRDPPHYRSEGPRVIEFGPYRLEYEIAPLPNRKVLARCSCTTGHSGSSYGWHHFESRKDVLDDVLSAARRHFDLPKFDSSATSADCENCPKMLNRLNADTLFGFLEPEPLPRSKWWDEMIGDRIHSMRLYRGWELLDVVRGMKNAPSKSGSFFDIPLPFGKQADDASEDEEQTDGELPEDWQ